MTFRNSLKPIRGVLPETLRMLLQVTHGSEFCSQQASYVRVGVWLTVVKRIHADISRARLRYRRSRNQFVKPDLCAISMSALTTPGDFVPDPPGAEELESGLIPSSCNGVDGGIP